MKIPFLRLTCHGLLLLAGLMLGPVAAADDKPLTYDRISLQAGASAEVGNDILVAVLFAQREGDNAQELAAEVNSPRLSITAPRRCTTSSGSPAGG